MRLFFLIRGGESGLDGLMGRVRKTGGGLLLDSTPRETRRRFF